MRKKYGKSYKNIKGIKSKFTVENNELLNEYDRLADIYRKQPIREKCKLCGEYLAEDKGFKTHDTKYLFCGNCGHVNGRYQDTEEYTSNLGVFSDIYKEETKESWEKRKQNIYVPKVDFMLESLQKNGTDIKAMRFLDVGAGSGYFVSALRDKGISANGIELSEDQVSYGNRMCGGKYLSQIAGDRVACTLRETTCNVISFIGVFEHIINLDEILLSICENENIRYVYFMVPMFSYSVMWEAVNDNVFNRHLGGGHTHLFTEESIKYLYEKYHWNPVGEWRFGTDMADLMRTVLVKLYASSNGNLAEIFETKFSEILDKLQLVMDESEFCTEIHALVEKV